MPYCSSAFALLRALPPHSRSQPFPEILPGQRCPGLLSCGCLWGWDPTDAPCSPYAWAFGHPGAAGGAPAAGRANQPAAPAPAAMCCDGSRVHHQPLLVLFCLKSNPLLTVSMCHQPRTLLVTVSASFLLRCVSEILWSRYCGSLKSLLPRVWALLDVMCVFGNICFKYSIIYLLKKQRNEQKELLISNPHNFYLLRSYSLVRNYFTSSLKWKLAHLANTKS